MSLTIKNIESARPGPKDIELRDGGGLVLRVAATGAKVFRYRIRSAGKVITIGRWTVRPQAGHVTLEQARAWRAKLKAGHRSGALAQVEVELAHALRPPPPADAVPEGAVTVSTAAKDFLAHLERKRRRPEQARRIFDTDILPVLGNRAMVTVTKADIRAVVETIVARGSPVMAGHALAILRQFFVWAADREESLAVPAFPKLDTVGGKRADQGQRVLSDAEIREFWRGLDGFSGVTPTVKNGLKLLLLLGIRSGELLQATWDRVDKDAGTLTIPPEHQKTAKRSPRPFVIPLPPLALKLVEELRALASAVNSGNVMASFHPAAKGEPISEKALNHAMRRLFTGAEPVLRFEGERPSPHDLRRTMRTGLARLGVARDVAERCLGHAIEGIEAVYNVHDFLPERRAALEKWNAHVEKIVGVPTAKRKRTAKLVV